MYESGCVIFTHDVLSVPMTKISKNKTSLKSARDLFALWPSIVVFADDIAVPYVTAQMMRYRGSIAPRHWPAVVAAAKRRGFTGITLELLLSLRSKQKQSSQKSERGNAEQTPRHAQAG